MKNLTATVCVGAAPGFGRTENQINDRADAVARLLSKTGGRLLGYYVTFGEYDFLTIADVPNDVQMAAVLLAAGSGGGVTDLRTTVALTSVEAKGAFAAAGDLAPSFKSAGGT